MKEIHKWRRKPK